MDAGPPHAYDDQLRTEAEMHGALIHAGPPAGVTVRALSAPADIRTAFDMQDSVFGGRPMAESMLAAIVAQQAAGESVEV